jgi:hypothetical protein
MTSLPELIPDIDFLLAMEAEERTVTMLPNRPFLVDTSQEDG